MTNCNRNNISMAPTHYLQYNANVGHHSMKLIHKEKSNKMQQCIKIYYSSFI